MPFKDID